MTKIISKIEHLDRIVQAVAEADKDAAELTRRSLIESGVADAVVAFQRVMEELYRNASPSSQKIPQNVFQRLKDDSDLWVASGNRSYDDILSCTEMARLKVFFHRRHLLAHKDGIVDEHYVQHSGDTKYLVGQRVIICLKHVVELVGLVKKLVYPYLPG